MNLPRLSDDYTVFKTTPDLDLSADPCTNFVEDRAVVGVDGFTFQIEAKRHMEPELRNRRPPGLSRKLKFDLIRLGIELD